MKRVNNNFIFNILACWPCFLFVIIIPVLILGFIHPDLNSDSLYIEVFQQDYLRDITLGDKWHQMVASAYFPDQLAYLFFRLFFSINSTLFWVAVVKVLLMAWMVYFFSRHVFETSKAKSCLFTLVLITLLITHFADENVFSLFHITMNHFMPHFAALFVTAILLRPMENKNWGVFFLVFVIGFISAVGSAASLLILGVLGASILFVKYWSVINTFPLKGILLRYRSLFLKTDVMVFIILLAGLIAGYLLYINIVNPLQFGERVWLFNDFMWNRRIVNLLKNAFGVFNKSYASLLFSYVTIFIIIANCFFRSTLPSRVKILFIALFPAFFLIFLLFAINGGIIDIYYFRYFYALEILSILLALYLINRQSSMAFNVVAICLIFLSILAHRNDFKINGQQFSDTLNFLPDDSKQLASCVNQNIKSFDGDRRIIIGVLDYWDANVSKVQFMDKKIDTYTIIPSGGVMLWMQNILTSESIVDRFYLAIKNGEQHLLPVQEHSSIQCPGGRWLLLDYGANNQLVINFIKSYSSYLLSQLDLPISKRMSWHGNWLPSTAAKQQRVHGAIRAQGPGYAHFGPYVTLNEGDYYAEIFYSLKSEDSNNLVRMEVGCVNNANHFHKIAETELLQGIGLIAKIPFSVHREDHCSSDYEVRTWIDEGTEMYLNRLTIVRK